MNEDASPLRDTPEVSLQDLQAAAERGDPAARFELGNRHAYGKGHPVNIRNALDLWYGAAQQGHAEAIFSIGICYFLGGGVAKDIGQAMRLWRQAAANGSVEAMHEMKDNITQEDRAEGIRLMQEWTTNPDSRLA